MTSNRSEYVFNIERLPGSENASRFDGHEHRASISFFINRHRPGTGPDLHSHPYEETFIVLDGQVRFTPAKRRSRRRRDRSSSFLTGRRTSS